MAYSVLILDICLIWILAAGFMALALGEMRRRHRAAPQPVERRAE